MILVHWEVVSLVGVFLHTGLLLGNLFVILTFYKEKQSESKGKGENESALLRQMKTKNGLPSCRQRVQGTLPNILACVLQGVGDLGGTALLKKSLTCYEGIYLRETLE